MLQICEVKTSEQKRQFLEILEKVAAHVRENGAFLWDPYELTEDRVFTDESMPCLGLADGVPVGTILLYDRDEFFWDDQEDSKALHIQKLSVLPAYEGKGYGSQLVAFAKELAKECSKDMLRIDCSNDRKDTLAFLQSVGFEITGITNVDNGVREYSCALLRVVL